MWKSNHEHLVVDNNKVTTDIVANKQVSALDTRHENSLSSDHIASQ